MTVKFTNNASTTVATGINTTATSLVVTSAAGFPTLSGSGDYCYLTIQQAAGTVREVVKATALSTNTFTIERAQDGTSAGSWSVSDVVELRVTAALLTDIVDAATHDSSVLSVDSTNNRVGVNDATPSVTLDISGTDAIALPVGTTAQRPSGAAGRFRYNSSLSQFEGYTDAWGAIGGGGTNTFTTDTFTANGSLVAFNLSQTVSSENNLLVFIDGVFQTQDAYSIATAAGTTTLTFSAAPANSRKIVVYSVAAGISGSNLNIDSMTGDGSDVTLTLSIAPVNENNTQVFFDGVYQSKSNYSISGTTLTFSTAPPTGTAVEVMTFTQTEINVPVDGTITSAKLSGALTTPSDLTVTGTSQITRLGLGVAAHASAALQITTTDQHIRLNNGSELGVIDLDSDGKLNIWAHGDGETINLKTGSGSGTDVLSVVGNNVGIGTGSTYNMRTTIAGAGSALTTGTGSYAVASIYDTATPAAGTGGGLAFQGDDGTNSAVTFATVNGSKENATTGNYASYLGFSTRANGGSLTENLRIGSSGDVGIRQTNPSAFNALGGKQVVIGSGAETNTLTLFSDDTVDGNGYGHVAFADSNVSSSTAQYAGLIQYFHGDNTMRFYTASTERMRIVDAGVRIGGGATAYTPAQFEIAALSGADRHSRNISSGTNSTISGSGQSSQMAEGVVAIDTVSAGTVLSIPHFSQPNLWRPMMVELMFVTGEYNRATGAAGGWAKCGYAVLNQITGFYQFEVGGNVASVSSSGMNLTVSFSAGYTSGLANYEGVCMYYKVMSITPEYFQAWNATLN